MGQPGLRFYAGASLISACGGHRLGTLCITDTSPRTLSPEQCQQLCRLADVVSRDLEQALTLQQERQTAKKLLSSAMECTRGAHMTGVLSLALASHLACPLLLPACASTCHVS